MRRGIRYSEDSDLLNNICNARNAYYIYIYIFIYHQNNSLKILLYQNCCTRPDCPLIPCESELEDVFNGISLLYCTLIELLE